MQTPMIKLKSSDGEIFQVEVKVAQLSLHLKEMLDNLGVEENEIISIPRNGPEISGAILGKIIQWANHHKDDPEVAEDDETKEKPTDALISWDAELLQVDQTNLFQLIRAANYLNIKGLLDVTCKKVAKMIKGMTLEEVRQTYNLQNDFSPDEEKQIHKESAWCSRITLKGIDSSEMHAITVDSIRNMDTEGCQVIEDCLNNPVVVRIIFQHLTDSELLKLSFVNKIWNYEARSVIKKRGNLFALVRCTDKPCQRKVEAFLAATQQMNVVPFSGINIRIRHRRSHACPNQVPDPLCDVTLDQLRFKKVSVDLYDAYLNCAGLKLTKKILQDSSEVLEEVSLRIMTRQQYYIEDLVPECRFKRLKVLKLGGFHQHSDETYTNVMKVLISRAPRLQDLHTSRPIDSISNVLEGSSAVILYTHWVRAPFDEILEADISSLRLEKLQLFYTGERFNLEKFSRIAPALLQASCTTTLRSVRLNEVLAVPLMCYGVCLKRVEELDMKINFETFEFIDPRILRTIKHFDFTRIFPKLNKVTVRDNYSTSLLFEHVQRIADRADAVLTDPKPDRAANIKELNLDSCNLSNINVEFFAEMFPSIEKLTVLKASGGEIPFGSIWKYWVDLKELEVTGRILPNTGNLDSVFCGIFPEEVAELRQRDEEYLVSVNIVPVMPAITCLKNLRVLSFYRNEYGVEPYTHDGTFMFSKVTGLIAFTRNPALAVSLKFCFNGANEETSHLKTFASVTVY